MWIYDNVNAETKFITEFWFWFWKKVYSQLRNSQYCSAMTSLEEWTFICIGSVFVFVFIFLFVFFFVFVFVFVKPILVWDIGFRCSPLSLLLYQSPFLLNPQTRLLCCNLFFKFMYVFFNVVFCTLYFLQPAFSTFVFCIFQSAFSSQRYLPTEPPSSHFYLLNSHLHQASSL